MRITIFVAEPGQEISQVVKEALAYAKRRKKVTHIYFNDTMARVEPTDTDHAACIGRWLKKRE